MSHCATATVNLHDKWRRALEGEDFKPSNSEPKLDDRTTYFLNNRRTLYTTLRKKMYRNGMALETISQDNLVDEAHHIAKLFKICGEMSSVTKMRIPVLNLKQRYGFDRLSKALVAVCDRLTITQERLRAPRDIRGPEMTPVQTGFYDSPLSQAMFHNEDAKKGINEPIQAQRAEVEALTQQNAEDKNNSYLFSLAFSRLLHQMAVHIQTVQKEKKALVVAYNAEILALHNHISHQRTFIDSMLLFITQTAEALSPDHAARRAQGFTESDTTPQPHDKEAAMRDLKQEMEQKEKDWEDERKEYEEKIAELEKRIEGMQTWEGEGAQWDAVGKKKLNIKGKGREVDS